jgi:hypothetical protein
LVRYQLERPDLERRLLVLGCLGVRRAPT